MTDKLIDFVQKRKESIEKKRRNFERLMFQNVLGCSTVLDHFGSNYEVNLLDISHDGCMVEVPLKDTARSQFALGTDIPLRFYFSGNQYIPAQVKIKRAQEYTDAQGQTYMRYGCQFDSQLPSFEALKTFIDFLYKFAEYSCVDKGDQKVYFL